MVIPSNSFWTNRLYIMQRQTAVRLCNNKDSLTILIEFSQPLYLVPTRSAGRICIAKIENQQKMFWRCFWREANQKL